MRRLIIFALLFGAGLYLLLRLERGDDGEAKPPSGSGPGVETPVNGPGNVFPENGDGPDVGSADGGSASEAAGQPEGDPAVGEGPSSAQGVSQESSAGDRPEENQDFGDGIVIVRGKQVFSKYDEETGQLVFEFQTENAEPIDAAKYQYRFHDVTIKLRDRVTAEVALTLQAKEAEGTLSVSGLGGQLSLANNGMLSMRSVQVDVLDGHPLAPFVLTGDEMVVQMDLGRFRGSGTEPVQLVGKDFSAKGWNLDMDQQAGQVHFIGGGEFDFVSEAGEKVHFVTEKGTPLRLNRVEQGETTLFEAHVDGGGEFNLDADKPWQFKARGLSLKASRVGQGPLVLEQVDTKGTLEATTTDSAFSGSDARLVRLDGVQGFDLHIENNPKAKVFFEDDLGVRQEIEVRGTGPLVVHTEAQEGTSEQADIEFQKDGSITFPNAESSTLVEFQEGLALWVDRLNRSGTFRATGNVLLSQGDAWLRTEVLDSIVWSADQQAIDVACEGQTKARLIDPENGQLDFSAEQGAILQVQGTEWRIPQASGIRTTKVGGEPLEIRANELRDLDWSKRTFRAWGAVALQNVLGSVQCERVESEGTERLALSGTPEQPVVIDLLAGSAISKDVLSGILSAQSLILMPDRIDSSGAVQADMLLRQGRLKQSAEELRLTLNRTEGTEDLGFTIFSSGDCEVTWSVADKEQTFIQCSSFQLDGAVPAGLGTGQPLPLVAEPNPYKIVAHTIREMRWKMGDDRMKLSGGSLTSEGDVWIGRDEQKVDTRMFRVDGGVDTTINGTIRAQLSGKSLQIEGTPRTVAIEPFEGDNIVASGLLPKLGIPYRMQSKALSINENRLEALEPEFRMGLAVFPAPVKGEPKNSETLLRAGRLLVTGQGLVFSDGVFASGMDTAGVPVTINSERLVMKGDVRRALGVQRDITAMERVEIEGGFQMVYGGLARARGREMVVLPSSLTLKGDSQMLVKVELADLYVETERLEFNLEDFLVKTTRGVMRGGSKSGAWAVDYASLAPIQRGGETMFAIASPKFSEGKRTATANWGMIWVHPNAWRQRGRAALWGEPLPEERDWAPTEPTDGQRPDAINDLLSSLSKQELPHYIRAALMEGNVEASVGGRRLARADSLYLDVDGTQAWLKNAEISKLLRMSGKDHKLRIKTGELAVLPSGELRAQSATLTTCDHDEPHYVIETRDLRLTPRPDQRWRFSAEHNRVAFQNGMGLPMPSIRNVVLDEEGGFEGFENDDGEVTTVDNIVLQNTPRFGTSLGTNLAYDIDKVGKFLASIFQFDSNRVRGKWKVDGSWLSSRGPRLGLGLQLREPGRERAEREEFWLDLYVRGIPDEGKDRGLLRVPESDTDSLRYWAHARGRYPFDDKQWIDVVFNQQNDPGVQAEFYQSEYQRYEERDSYVHWRKARGGHYFSARYQWRQDDFRTVVEKLPSLGFFRGLQELFRIGTLPVNYSASADLELLRRREGDPLFERQFLDATGVPDGLGSRSTMRADSTHRLEMPLPLNVPGMQLTPFAEARFTAWDEGVDATESPSRFVSYGGARLQALFTRISGESYHTLIPRISVKQELSLEESGGAVIGFDGVEDAVDGDFSEVGLRSLWRRPDEGRWLDFDVAVRERTNRLNALPDSQELRFLGGFRTEFGGVPVGIEQDLRQDLESNDTLYSRSIFAVRPTDDLLMQFGHQRGFELGLGSLFETASLDMRYRLNDKWELGATNYTNLLDGGSLQSNFTLRRFSHDFVLELEVSHFAGEGGTGIGINLVPLLAWKPNRLGILDR